MHVVVSGWLLGPHSGANQRLLSVLAHAGDHLQPEERITVLHRPEYVPPTLPRTNWLAVDIPTDQRGGAPSANSSACQRC